ETFPLTRTFFSAEVIIRAFPVVLNAFPVSLLFGILGFFLAIPGGFLLAFMKMTKNWVLRGVGDSWILRVIGGALEGLATLYIDIVRGTPLFLQILIVFFGLPLLSFYKGAIAANPWMKQPFLFGVDFTYYLRGLLVLSLNSSAYLAEIFRAGIQSIHKGQMEAARSLGMGIPTAMVYVIIPQTIRRILPTSMSEFILLFKDTALLSAVGLAEITLRAREVTAVTWNMSSYMVAAVFYLVVTIPLGRVVARLEERLAESEGEASARPVRNADERSKRAVQKAAS
ncbi:MAG: amino acid ABC transporter permease, partial [Coriobacteriia bacterium]|nr:amino acid ABC transporter permease [Coriobacteriia bacterium]